MLRAALEARFGSDDGDLEITPIFGGSLSVAVRGTDARDLTDIARSHNCGYSVSTGFSATAVSVTFDPTANWSTPLPFAGAYWPGDVVSALSSSVVATELGARASGATRVVRFTGMTVVDGSIVDRIMASPHVVDVRFLSGQFDVLLARESPTLGGLSHLVATKKITRRRRGPRRALRRGAVQAVQAAECTATAAG